MVDYKKIGTNLLKYGTGGAITVFLGNWILPYITKWVTLISSAPLPFVNISVHQIAAYGTGFAVAKWVDDKYFK